MNLLITELSLPITQEKIKDLKKGDLVYLSGEMFTARDNTHKKILELIEKNENLPFQLNNICLYYMGPSPKKENMISGSAGPTTSSRMDKYTPLLISKGLKYMLGKGYRSKEVISSIKENNAFYFSTIGGAGAYLASKILKMECFAFPELGAEAMYKLLVKDLPAVIFYK
jgi:fumarate hydratase subunit beta